MFCWSIIHLNRSMKKKENNQKYVVSYLKVSPYIKSYMECKYGKVICFPAMSPHYSCLCRYLVNNASMSGITEFAFSENAFNYSNPDSFFVGCPSEEIKAQCIAIALPKTIFREYREIEVNAYWQLSRTGAIEMRRLLKNDFMVELFKFIDDCMTRARINGTKAGREQSVDDFITMFDIDMSWRETLIRYDQRDRKKISQEIEARREKMEELYDRQFCYT